MMSYFRFSPKDLPASLVVFIVALPVALSASVITGTHMAAALIAVGIGGILVGLLSGCPLIVSGPATFVAAFAYNTVHQYGIEGLAASLFIAGTLQITFGFMRIGIVFSIIPKGVLRGLMAATGCTLLATQIHALIGQPVPGDFFDSLFRIYPALREGLSDERYFILPEFACGLVALAVMLVWPRIFRGSAPISGAVPAVALATAASLSWDMDRMIIEPLAPVVTAHIDGFFSFEWIRYTTQYMVEGYTIALVTASESLITAHATDLLAREKNPNDESIRPLNLNQQLVAQGISNAASGILGGLPLAGVIARSSANAYAGGQTRWSTILHGVWALAFAALAPELLQKIPLTVLAAVLVIAGYQLLDFKGIRLALRRNRREGMLWIITLLAIVASNLLYGLLFGLAAAIVFRLEQIFSEERDSAPEEPAPAEPYYGFKSGAHGKFRIGFVRNHRQANGAPPPEGKSSTLAGGESESTHPLQKHF